VLVELTKPHPAAKAIQLRAETMMSRAQIAKNFSSFFDKEDYSKRGGLKSKAGLKEMDL
jgi:hypothetical protein